MKKSLFCAHCQIETEQDFRVSPDGKELLAACACGREIKFPASLDAAGLRAAFASHKAANLGQVPASEIPIGPDHPALKALAEL